jgi:hypothetical protein
VRFEAVRERATRPRATFKRSVCPAFPRESEGRRGGRPWASELGAGEGTKGNVALF